MKHSELLGALYDAELRVEQLIWLPGVLATFEDGRADALREFIEDLPEQSDADLYTDLPELKDFANSDGEISTDLIAEILTPRSGFLVQGAHPVRRHISEHTFESGWGYYHTVWRHVSTIDHVLPVLGGWALRMDAKQLAKWKAGAS